MNYKKYIDIFIENRYAIFIGIIFIPSAIILHAAGTSGIGFGDETYYCLAAESIIENDWVIPKAMTSIYNTGDGYGEPLGKPALAYYLPTVFYHFGLFNIFAAVFSVATIFLLFYVVTKMYNEYAGFIAAVVLAGIPIFIHFSIISYIETLLTFTSLLAFYLIWKAIERPSRWGVPIAGVALGLAFYVKEFAYLLLPTFFIFIFIRKGGFKKEKLKTFLYIAFIGLLMVSPWLVRNNMVFGNPVFPQLQSVFGTADIDKAGWDIHDAKTGGAVRFIDFASLYIYLDWAFILSIIGSVFFWFNRENEDRLLLIAFLIFFIPMLLINASDVRYMFFNTVIMATMSAFFITELMEKDMKKWLRVAWIVFACLLVGHSFMTSVQESGRISTEIRPQFRPMNDAMDWVRWNTPEDSVIYDLWVPNCAYLAKRQCTYPGVYQGSMMWNWWEKPDALEILEFYSIDYVMVEMYLFGARDGTVWTYTPFEAANFMANSDDFKTVYINQYMVIFEVLG